MQGESNVLTEAISIGKIRNTQEGERIRNKKEKRDWNVEIKSEGKRVVENQKIVISYIDLKMDKRSHLKILI